MYETFLKEKLLCLLITNKLLVETIKYLSKAEKFSSTTIHRSIVAVKLTIAMFINTGLVCFIVYRNDWYGENSLIV